MHKSTFSSIVYVFIIICGLFHFQCIANAQEITRSLGLWPRGDAAYLAAGQSMPLWLQLPPGTKGDLTLKVTLPAGFQITSWGKSKAFAVLPKPLVVPAAVKEVQNDATNVVYEIEIPASELPDKGFGRLALMVNPGANAAEDYDALLQLGNTSAKVLLTVLPPLQGKQPQRLQIGAYNYNGLSDEAWLRDLGQAVLKSGINQLWDMWPVSSSTPPADIDKTLASHLKERGVNSGAMWFWKRFASSLAKIYPQAVRLDADGNSDPAAGIASTWVIENRDKVMPLLEANLESTFAAGLYDGLVLDHEERAISRDDTVAEGDIYNPGTMAAFARFAGLDGVPPTDPQLLAQRHAAQWIEFRTWQSAQLSAMVAEAAQKIDPFLSYGVYSGYQYAPPLEGRTKQWYSVDWSKMADAGKVQFGSAGYGGSVADLRNTAKALDTKTFIPAEMYVVNFLADVKTLSSPERFAVRLLSAFLHSGARGGVNIWYLSVLDAGAYSAIARVSHLLADVEPILLDGKRADNALNLPRDLDSADVFAWELDQRRLVIVLNRSTTQTMNFKAAWKDKLALPDTTELVSGRKLGNATLLEATLKPNEFAAFMTFSDGN